MTQEELAAKMGYKGKSSVCAAETGGDNVTTTKVKKYAQALGVTAEYLMGWDEFTIVHDGNIIYDKDELKNELKKEIEKEKVIENEKAQELYSLYEKASPEIQSAVELLLRSAQHSPESQPKN